MKTLGIDIGSASIKAVMLNKGKVAWHEAVAHDGDIPGSLRTLLDSHHVKPGILSMSTGNAGRKQLNMPSTIPPQAIEAGLALLDEKPNAIVSLGGESIVVYIMDEEGRIQAPLTGDKCAAGTGEFFRQQLGRMDMPLDILDSIADDTKPVPLSSRCSVFMKSDCTHKLNKSEASKEEIVVSLANVMAFKTVEFLTRARITQGRVLLIGGVTQNRFLRRFLKQGLPEIDFVYLPESVHFEAVGVAHLAIEHGQALPEPKALFSEASISFERYPRLADSLNKVHLMPQERGKVRAGGRYILGIDGGSTTTKAVLVDAETRKICADHYGRTHGDPVKALRGVLKELKKQVQAEIGDDAIQIDLAATTGSGREVLGVFTETQAVYNEIIAHSIGSSHFAKDIDTIFEIGGQDAKYVHLHNGVPTDYAMNEACSAGTGSFLEESAQGDLNIGSATDIGPLALESQSPLKFGEHCSAFINSDIRAAIQQGASKPDIVAGVVFSIVSNYLNRVVGNRSIGDHIVLQGGVAKNPAVPAAFASVLGCEISVPPDPELLGAFGVALLAMNKEAEGSLDRGEYGLDRLIDRQISTGRTFTCKACENHCPIRTIKVDDHKYFFGGRCNKFANQRKRSQVDLDNVTDFVEVRRRLMFEEYAPEAQTLKPRTKAVVGIPRAFTFHSLWPLYSWFFHDLGVRTELSHTNMREGVQKAEAAYCLPGEIAHGMTEDLLRRNVDYLFVPHVQMMQTMEEDVHATLCPITQGLPYYLRPAFELDDARLLRPVIDFGRGYDDGSKPFVELAERLGFSEEEGLRAFRTGLSRQMAFWERLHTIGRQVLERAHKQEEIVIGLFGRSYNALTADANMGIPRKLSTRGVTVLPFDFFPIDKEEISANMYWYYGQINLKAAKQVKQHPNVYMTYISNFGCAPDSFILHFIRWTMGAKPFLVLELDSHTADAGVDTRIEAFLDIIDGYRAKIADREEVIPSLRYRTVLKGHNTFIEDKKSGEKLALTDPRVRMVWPSMGDLTTEAMATVVKGLGFHTEYLPVANHQTTQLARAVSSGKECIPTLLVLGQILKLLTTQAPKDNEVLAIVVPKTTGPCRTGQYGPFYEGTLAELGIDNVTIIQISSDNGYKELGPDFTRLAWYAVVLGDFFKDIKTALAIMAVDQDHAMREFDAAWRDIIDTMRVDVEKIYKAVERAAKRLSSIETLGRVDDLPKTLIVGEIYVRRDDFSVQELLDHLIRNGIFGKITGLSEWVHYCDYSQAHRAWNQLGPKPWYMRPFTPGFAEWMGVKLTSSVEKAIEGRMRDILKPTGLLPSYPHDMKAIMADVNSFTHADFETEATVSTLVAVQAAKDGYDGIVAIAPFACLPGRLIRAMLDPYSRKHNIPFIALENDGLAYPPSTLSHLEVFMLNVLRRSDARHLSDDVQGLRSFFPVELATLATPNSEVAIDATKLRKKRPQNQN